MYFTLCKRGNTLNKQNPDNNRLKARLSRTSLFLLLTTAAWVFSIALLTFGPEVLWQYDFTLTHLAIALNLLTGIVMLRAYFEHLSNMDELQRQTHLEAMALTLGVTMILTVIYGGLASAKLVSDTHPTNLLFVVGATYIFSVIVLWLRRTAE